MRLSIGCIMLWDAGFLTRRIESAYRNFYQNTSLKSGTSKSRRLQFLDENPRDRVPTLADSRNCRLRGGELALSAAIILFRASS